jgi:hypothetical protein
MGVFLVNGGRINWQGERDTDGYRTYKVKFLVATTSFQDGPASALQCPGLPQVGEPWVIGNDVDVWAWFKETATITPRPAKPQDPNRFFEVELLATTKPDEKRCKKEQIEDPLLKPQELSGESNKYQEEIVVDRFGRFVSSSSHELFHGPKAEFDRHRHSVKIEQNVPLLQLQLVDQMIDCVNAYPLWGLPPRCIKLSTFHWKRAFYGSCSIYFIRTFGFDIDVNTFDRWLLDEGTKALNGHWDRATGSWTLDNINGQPPDSNNPSHFNVVPDRNGNPMKNVVLNGAGLPAGAKIIAPSVPDLVYASLTNANTNHNPATDTTNWFQTTSKMLQYSSNVYYLPGNLVSYGQFSYLRTGGAIVGGPVPSSLNGWAELPLEPPDKGEWLSSASYSIGDMVKANVPGKNVASAGYKFVSAYSEADFLQLAIPVDLESLI